MAAAITSRIHLPLPLPSRSHVEHIVREAEEHHEPDRRERRIVVHQPGIGDHLAAVSRGGECRGRSMGSAEEGGGAWGYECRNRQGIPACSMAPPGESMTIRCPPPPPHLGPSPVNPCEAQRSRLPMS